MQERCARGDAWIMAKSILKLKEKDKATFFSPIEPWCFSSAILNKSRGASVHMLSKKDLKLNRIGDSASFPNSCSGYSSQWRSANK